MKTMIRVLIDQPKYDIRTEKGSASVRKYSELQVQTKDVPRNERESMELENQGYKYNSQTDKYERPKIGGVVIDNIGEILGHVYEPEKYDVDMKRKQEYYIPYDWSIS